MNGEEERAFRAFVAWQIDEGSDGLVPCGTTGEAATLTFDEQRRLVFQGRINDIIKTGGANVSPLEIDEVLRTIAGVKIVQTVGVPHDTLGEIVVACVIPFEGAALDENQVRDAAKTRLASYKVPRRVLFFREDELELTGSNKIKASELRKVAAERLGS